MTENSAAALHRDAIIIDAVCPLLRDRRHLDLYIEGGVTVAAPTIASSETASETFRRIGGWKRAIQSDPRLRQVRTAADVATIKRDGKLGILFHFQGADPIEDDLGLVDVYRELGVLVVQLCYNIKNRVGDGADERTDSGLSYFGVDLIRRLNEAKVIVDCSHTGARTTADAIEVSAAPVIISHGNAAALHASRRNVSDDLIRAVAAKGGVIGVVGFPGFVSASPRPTLDQFIDHIAYMADLVGIDHVSLGIDFYDGQHPVVSDAEAKQRYDGWIASGKWRSGTYPPPPHYYPDGIATPAGMPNLTRRLMERGFAETDIRKVLGENCLRVYRAVWGA